MAIALTSRRNYVEFASLDIITAVCWQPAQQSGVGVLAFPEGTSRSCVDLEK